MSTFSLLGGEQLINPHLGLSRSWSVAGGEAGPRGAELLCRR